MCTHPYNDILRTRGSIHKRTLPSTWVYIRIGGLFFLYLSINHVSFCLRSIPYFSKILYILGKVLRCFIPTIPSLRCNSLAGRKIRLNMIIFRIIRKNRFSHIYFQSSSDMFNSSSPNINSVCIRIVVRYMNLYIIIQLLSK